MEKVDNIIRSEIEYMFGRRIVGSRDCIQLSEEIFRITKARLNPNTLRRFFGLVKTMYAPSGSTMQILCSYCGFLSVDDLRNYRKDTVRQSEGPEEGTLINYLVNLFRETPVENERNETFKSVVKQTILFLNQYPGLVEKFQSMVAKTKNGQDYYFEGFSQIDRLNSSFGNGLRYFLKEKNDPEAAIFGHSLLIFRCWLTEDEPDMERHFNKLMNTGHHPSLSYNASGRYFAALLYYAETKEYASSDTLSGIRNYNVVLEGIDVDKQINFEIIIAEALILTGNFEEGMYYSDMALKKLQSMQSPDESSIQNLYLLQTCALYNMGDKKNAALLYPCIRPTYFNFLNKKMQTILYGLLTAKMKNTGQDADNQSLLLIQETGFKRLLKLMRFKERPVSSVGLG